jgi:prepilin-type N-terminal cleavage/methylation domain-containing protein
MLARIRKSIEDKDQGFTLIELLVVMIIIGILAAIAIPVFLNQRKKAVDSSIKSDLRTIAQQEETAYTDAQAYYDVVSPTDLTKVTVNSVDVKISSGNTFTAVPLKADGSRNASDWTTAAGFCITGKNTKGSDASNGFIYNSLNGGLKTASAASGSTPAVACPS